MNRHTVLSVIAAAVTFVMVNSQAYGIHITQNLTSEQMKTVNDNAYDILMNCSLKISDDKIDPGVLCDSFFAHLKNRCEEFGHAFSYCNAGNTISIQTYGKIRSIQEDCITNPPIHNNTYPAPNERLADAGIGYATSQTYQEHVDLCSQFIDVKGSNVSSSMP